MVVSEVWDTARSPVTSVVVLRAEPPIETGPIPTLALAPIDVVVARVLDDSYSSLPLLPTNCPSDSPSTTSRPTTPDWIVLRYRGAAAWKYGRMVPGPPPALRTLRSSST